MMNVTIFAVAIGTAVDIDEMAEITGNKENVIVIKDLSTVSHVDFARMLVNKTCRKIGTFSFTLIQDSMFTKLDGS